MRGEQITTASDIYSLGVLLYRLLTGCHPYAETGPPHEIARRVCEEEPEKPSTAAARTELPKAVGNVRHQLVGDLDNIILMALRKQPQRRYASAEQFSEDIHRHLNELPVIARKDTPSYRGAKFVKRHKAG